MPKSAARSRRSVATVTGTAVIGASLAVLLLPVATPLASAAAAPGSTQRASVINPDKESTKQSGSSQLSGDGNSVAFESSEQMDDLPTNGEVNIYVRDLVRKRTVMITRGQFVKPPPSSGPVVHFGPDRMLDLQPGQGGTGSDGVPGREFPPDSGSFSPSISADGRYVAFHTYAENIVPENTPFSSNILICDRDPDGDGDYDETAGNGTRDYAYYRVTPDFDELRFIGKIRLAANATRIVWDQQLREGEGEGERMVDRVWTAALNLRLGQAGIGAAELVPAELPNARLLSDFDPAISADGNHVALVGEYQPTIDREQHRAVVSTDMRNRQVTRVDFDNGTPISKKRFDYVMRPAISGDGTVIAFVSEEFHQDQFGNIVSVLDQPNIFVEQVDYTKHTTKSDIVSRDNDFNLANGEMPGLSADGRYIAFVTDSRNMHDGADGQTVQRSCINNPPEDLVGERKLRLNAAQPADRRSVRTWCQVVVRDLTVDRDRLVSEQSRLKGTLVSPNQDGNAANRNTIPNRAFGSTTSPSLSANGGRVGYDSQASDLVRNDTNNQDDVFVRTLEPTLSGSTVQFGQVQINTTSTKTAQLTVTGQGPVVVEQATIAGPNAGEFSVGGQTCTGQTIHQTGGCEVSVKFSPKTTGDKRAQLVIQIRGRKDPVRVDLTGTGTEVPVKDPEFAAGPDPLNFGSRLLLSKGPESTVTITNKGEAALQIQNVDIVGPGTPEDYTVTTNTCGSVPGGGQCTVSIAFSPKASGGRNAVLRFTDNAPGGPHLVGLSGSAPQPTIQVNPGVTPPGRVISVIGKDFPPVGLPVTVKFDGRPGETTIIPNGDGTFQAPLLVFPKSSPETRQVLAQMPQFSGNLANAPLLVVLATVSPANFVVRG